MITAAVSAIILAVIDQISKIAALKYLKPIESISLIKGIMNLTFVENRGAAFGILNGKIWLLLILAAIICAVIIYSMLKMPKTKEYRLLKAALTLILAGAVGNVIDRVIRGYVVDFFEFTFISFPVFNMADIYVVVGAIAMALIMIFVIKDEDKTGNGGN